MSICTVDRKELLGALSLASSAIAAKPIQPILSHALLTATATALTIEATDQKIGVRATIPCRADKPFKASASGSFMAKLAGSFDGDTITIEALPNHWLNVGDGNAQFKIVGLDPAEFPSFPQMSEIVPRFSLPAIELLSAIRSVTKMQGVDTAKLYMCGVHFACDGATLELEATSGTRIAQTGIALGISPFKAIVPTAGIDSLMAIIASRIDGNVELAVSDGAIEATCEASTVSCRLLEGQFPPVNQVMPKDQPISIPLPVAPITSAIRRIGLLLAGATSSAIRIEFVNRGVEFSAVNTDLGSAKQRVELPDMAESINLTIACNWKYLVDALDSAPTDMVNLLAIDDVMPITMTAANWRCAIGLIKIGSVAK